MVKYLSPRRIELLLIPHQEIILPLNYGLNLPKGGIEPPFESYKETVLPIKLFRLMTNITLE